ncbi:aminotransferase class IV [Streptomyces pharetrae]|uniref:aminotransferase class IV n=1 Tax=Streptomyces pharetrae TaxID=291370 RepID=UPI003662C806
MATLDGEPVSADDLLPLALTNLGHFTTVRVEADGTVRGLSRHLDRLVRDCGAVLGAGLDPGRVRDLLRQQVHGQALPCVVRVTVYDPRADLGNLARAGEPHVLLSVRAAAPVPPRPLRAMTVAYERDVPQVKHVGLFGALHARRIAQLAGYGDALFVDRDGRVSEGSTWNVGFVDRDGTVVWPRAEVLPGVTMALLKQHTGHRVAPHPGPGQGHAGRVRHQHRLRRPPVGGDRRDRVRERPPGTGPPARDVRLDPRRDAVDDGGPAGS